MDEEGADVEMQVDDEEADDAWLEAEETSSKEEGISLDVEGERVANMERAAQLDAKTRALASALSTKNTGELLAAVEDMRRIITSTEGGDVLQNYVLASPKCSELEAAWDAGPGSVVSVPLLQLLSDILRHPVGRVSVPGILGSGRESEQGKARILIRLRLDKLASSIVRNRMKALYSHLSSTQRARQNAALILLTCIVCRGRLLAVEVAKNFDFTFEGLRKLSRPPWLPAGKMMLENQSSPVLQPTRLAFIEFAMSFLSMGDPGLVRWILLKRPLYAGVLNVLARDDEATILSVLRTIQNKVINPTAVVPPGILNSVFGDGALDQLAQIVANTHFQEAAELAYQMLVQFCTHPAHGLHADKFESTTVLGRHTSGGGHSRILRLFLQLKPTAVNRHKHLLIAIASSNPKLAAAYLDSLPFSLQPRVSSSWFSVMSIVGKLVPIASEPPPFSSFAEQGLCPPPLDGVLVQSCIRSLIPRGLPRGALNKGLQHANVLVKLISLKVILVTLQSAERLLSAILEALEVSTAIVNGNHQRRLDTGHKNELTGMIWSVDSSNCPVSLHSTLCLPTENKFGQFHEAAGVLELGKTSVSEQWIKFARYVQDSLRGLLPDPQLVLGLVNSGKVDDGETGLLAGNKKRKPHVDDSTQPDRSKKQRVQEIAKGHDANFDLATGVDSEEGDVVDNLETYHFLHEAFDSQNTGDLLYENVLEVLSAYQRVLPVSMADNNFDAFKLLPDDVNSLSSAQQKALLALLLSATDYEFGGSNHTQKVLRADLLRSAPIFKHLKSFLWLMVSTCVDHIREKAQKLAVRAMLSTGAFDTKSDEVWLLLDLIPKMLVTGSWEKGGSKTSKDVHSLFVEAVVTFLSEAINAVGQNIYKFVDQLHTTLAADAFADIKHFSTRSEGSGRKPRKFGPFVPAILSKWQCSNAVTLPHRAATSLYVASVLTNILMSQAYPRPLAMLINVLLKTEHKDSKVDSKEMLGSRSREWIPLKQLLLTARDVIHRSDACNPGPNDGDLPGNVSDVPDVFSWEKQREPTASDLANCILFSSPKELVDHFPSLVEIMARLCQSDFSLLFFHMSVHKSLLQDVANTWPDIFKSCLILLGPTLRESPVVSTPLSAGTTALAQLLKQLPFYILFPSLASSPRLLSLAPLISLLEDTIFNMASSRWLFSANLILSSIAELGAMECTTQVCAGIQTCFTLLNQIVMQFNTSDGMSTTDGEATDRITCYSDLISGVLAHPVFLEFLRRRNKKSVLALKLSQSGLRLDGKNLADVMDQFINYNTYLKSKLASGRKRMELGDFLLLELLKRILEQSQLLGMNFRMLSANFQQVVISACQPHIRSTVTAFHVQLARSEGAKKLVGSPSYYAMTSLLPHVTPDILVDVLFSLFAQTPEGGSSPLTIDPSLEAPTLCLTTLIFFVLSSVPIDSKQSQTRDQDLFDAKKFEKLVYVLEAVAEITVRTGSELGDKCLLFALRGIRSSGNGKEGPTLTYSTSSVPLELLWYCVNNPTRTKAQILVCLLDYSPVLIQEFGRALAFATCDGEHTLFDQIDMEMGAAFMVTYSTDSIVASTLSDDGLMLLLSPALIYLSYQVKTVKIFSAAVIPKHVARVYGSFLRETITQWDRAKFSMDELVQTTSQPCPAGCYDQQEQNPQWVLYNSTLGMIVRMLHLCLCLEVTPSTEIKSLSRTMLSTNDTFLQTIGSSYFSSSETKKRQGAAETVARVAILGGLLAPAPRCVYVGKAPAIPGFSFLVASEKTQGQGPQESRSRREIRKLVKLMSFVVSALDMILKSNTWDNCNRMQSTESSSGRWFLYTEETLLQCFADVAKSVESAAWDSHFLSMVKSLFTLVLKYRFTSIIALNTARSVTEYLMGGAGGPASNSLVELSSEVLDLILSHSQFVVSLVPGKHQSVLPVQVSAHAARGAALSSLPFLLGLIGSPRPPCSEVESRLKQKNSQSTVDMKVEKSTQCEQKIVQDEERRLELVKLLRALTAMKMHPISGKRTEDDVVTLRELLSLLLAAYGATMSPVDLEIFHLMHEIELNGGVGFCGLSGMNYLWGQAGGKRRNVKNDEKQATSSGGHEGQEADFEIEKRNFKEDLDVDPRRCGLTVWCFPQRRGPWSSLGTQVKGENRENVLLGLSQNFDPADKQLAEAAYDPAFILPFALQSLVKGYLSAEDFVRLGLLAVSLASISSADEGMRKLGYEILSKYMKALEDGPRFKGSQQIQVLLTSVKNAITDPWQRIPFVSSVFAGEASCILMHPEGVHYLAVNRFLLQGPSLDVEHVPLLHTMLGSGQPQFRNERAWILRLLAAGLMSSLDAGIYRRRFILEILMSLYSSPLSDLFTRKWVLQVLKKASRIRSCAHHMVEHLGALSWLCSAAVVKCEPEAGGYNQHETLDIPSMCLQVLESVLRWKTVQEYGCSEGFDELVKISLQLHKHLATKVESARERRIFQGPALRIMTMVIRLSQRRKNYQTKLRLPLKFLVDIVDWAGKADGTEDEVTEGTRALALLLVLHSPPQPVSSSEDRAMLLQIASWAGEIALAQLSYPTATWDNETLAEKLLRWISASLVLRLERNKHLSSAGGPCADFWSLFSNCLSGSQSTATCSELGKLLVKLHAHILRESSEVSLESVVNSLVMLLPAAGVYLSDSHKAVQDTLQLILTELPPPAEITPSWHWSFKRRSSGDEEIQSAYVHELHGVLLVMCQQLLTASSPSFQCHLVEKWKKGLQCLIRTTSISSGNELQKNVKTFRERLAAALQSV